MSSYQRKQEEQRRLEKMTKDSGSWPSGVYQETKENGKKYYKRYWRSTGKNSSWAWNKRHARRVARRLAKKTGIYNKNSCDLWWNVY